MTREEKLKNVQRNLLNIYINTRGTYPDMAGVIELNAKAVELMNLFEPKIEERI